MCTAQFPSNDRGPQSHRVRIVDLAKQLGPTVQVLGVWPVDFLVVASAAVENTVRADMNKPSIN